MASSCVVERRRIGDRRLAREVVADIRGGAAVTRAHGRQPRKTRVRAGSCHSILNPASESVTAHGK